MSQKKINPRQSVATPQQQQPLKQIKTSVFSRSLAVAKLGLNAGLKYASSKITQTPIDEFLTSQAQLFTQEFGQLKGSLMKAGQMLSMYGEYFFPPQANQIIKSLQSDSAPIAWDVMKKNLELALDSELIDELVIDPTPIGTASLGQVHKAQIKSTREWIALKIQYPGVDKAIDSDLSALKTLLKLSQVLPENIDLTAVFENVKRMLLQELDYSHEAVMTQAYHEKMKGDPRYIVPQVYQRYSNKKILATAFIEGFKADHPLIQALSQTRRNQLSENFLDLYFKEIFHWNLIQTDPHLGNYKIQLDPTGKNDRLVLLDFGACCQVDTHYINNYRLMIKASIENNKELLHSACRQMGFLVDSDPPAYIQTFEDFCSETVEPFLTPDDPRLKAGKMSVDGVYHWKETDLPHRVMKKALQFKNFDLRTPPQDMIFLDRKTGGVFIFLSVLQAQINARKIIDPYLRDV